MIELLDLKLSLPEITVLIGALSLLILDVFGKRGGIINLALTLFAAIIFIIYSYNWGVNTTIFSGQLAVDNLATILKLAIASTTFLSLCYSRKYLIDQNIPLGEFFALVLFSMLGMFILVSSKNMLAVYLGLEVFSISLYALVAITRKSLAVEAAMKYFLTGALASGILLYGISILYGLSGSLQLDDVAKIMATNAMTGKNIVLSFAYIFIIVAIAFKLGLAPFHLWMPDVYQGANNTIASYVSAASKLAATGFAFRLIFEVVPPSYIKFSYFLEFLAIMSILFGNLMAIAQNNIKRMLAYSSISHMGFFALGLLVFSKDGSAAALFYIISYAIMTTVAFGAIIFLSTKESEADLLNDFKGLNLRSPYLAFMVLITMFSMAGVPPFSGFFAKFFILEELINGSHINLAIFALLMSVVGAFYYLRIVWLIYFDKPDNFEPVEISGSNKIIFSINALFVILLGIFAQFGVYICKLAF